MNEYEAKRRRDLWENALVVLNDRSKEHSYPDLFMGLAHEHWMRNGMNVLTEIGAVTRAINQNMPSHCLFHATREIPADEEIVTILLKPGSLMAITNLRAVFEHHEVEPETTRHTKAEVVEAALAITGKDFPPGPDERLLPGPAPDPNEMLTALVNALPLVIDAIVRIEHKIDRLYRELGGKP